MIRTKLLSGVTIAALLIPSQARAGDGPPLWWLVGAGAVLVGVETLTFASVYKNHRASRGFEEASTGWMVVGFGSGLAHAGLGVLWGYGLIERSSRGGGSSATWPEYATASVITVIGGITLWKASEAALSGGSRPARETQPLSTQGATLGLSTPVLRF